MLGYLHFSTWGYVGNFGSIENQLPQQTCKILVGNQSILGSLFLRHSVGRAYYPVGLLLPSHSKDPVKKKNHQYNQIGFSPAALNGMGVVGSTFMDRFGPFRNFNVAWSSLTKSYASHRWAKHQQATFQWHSWAWLFLLRSFVGGRGGGWGWWGESQSDWEYYWK